MKRIIAYIRDGKFEEIIGCLAIIVVIAPVIANIVNRSVLNFTDGICLDWVWLFRVYVQEELSCRHEVYCEQNVSFC